MQYLMLGAVLYLNHASFEGNIGYKILMNFLSFIWQSYVGTRGPHAVNTAWAMLALIYGGQVHILHITIATNTLLVKPP